jgi:cyclic pyranopterin phosphate synthase
MIFSCIVINFNLGDKKMIDKCGRKVNYLRVSLTDKCNLRCVYCMPKHRELKDTENMTTDYENLLKIIKASVVLGINKVRFTGGEPLILKKLDNLIEGTSKIPGIKEICLTTNGLLLKDRIDDLRKAGLTRVNISLDTLNDEKYQLITRGGNLKKVKEGIDRCFSIGIKPVKLNVVLMKGINDDEIDEFINLTKDMPVHVRFIELMPIGEGAKIFKERFLSSKDIIEKNSQLMHLGRNENETAELYKLPEGKGKIGFINPLSCKFCKDCNRIRLTHELTIKHCLHSEEEFDLKPYIHNELLLVKQLQSIIYQKPSEHNLAMNISSANKKSMFQIGG